MAINDYFGFNRTLPAPFTSKAVKGVSSKYATTSSGSRSGYSTLSAPIIKAVNAFCKMGIAPENGGVGVSADGKKSFAEYRSSTGEYHLFCYENNGKVKAAVYDPSVKTAVSYEIGPKARDCAGLFLALMPVLTADEEFAWTLAEYAPLFNKGIDFTNVGDAEKHLALLCDNAYRRIKDKTCPAHIEIEEPKMGYFSQMKLSAIDTGAYTPDSIVAGEFNVLAKAKVAGTSKKVSGIVHSTFVGQYDFDPGRVFTEQEEELMYQLPESYILSNQIVRICKLLQKTTSTLKPMRNILLMGPAGSGKSQGAAAIAAGIHRPFVQMCLSADTQSDSLIGCVRPVFADERESVSLSLPSAEDIVYDPVGAYKKLTGLTVEDISSDECLAVMLDKAAQNSGNQFVYQETPLIQALRYGWVCEIQEPTVVMQPGVLVALNSLMEEGVINLPNGEVLHRHPDCVIILTTNLTYNGCRDLNQSLRDRCRIKEMMPTPDKSTLMARVMAATGEEDTSLVSSMVDTVLRMQKYCAEKSIDDGEVGYRALEAWVMANQVLENPFEAALSTIIPSATSVADDQEELISAILEPKFPR